MRRWVWETGEKKMFWKIWDETGVVWRKRSEGRDDDNEGGAEGMLAVIAMWAWVVGIVLRKR